MSGEGYEVFLSHAGADGNTKMMLSYAQAKINELPMARKRAFLDETSLQAGLFSDAIHSALQSAIIGASHPMTFTL